MDKEQHVDRKKYILVFFITITLFLTAVLLSTTVNNKKITELQNIQQDIALDILASETQYALLEELRCSDVTNSLLSQELNSLARKLEYGEDKISGSQGDLDYVRDYYSLLQIKDFLLMQKAEERCSLDVEPIVYFYSSADACTECEKQGYVLTSLRETYPKIRVYSFDYNSDVSAVQALATINKVPNELPALVIDGKVHTGFQSLEMLQEILPKTAFEIPEPNTTEETQEL